MNVQHLHYFITLAKMEHYTKTSDKLGISQPNLSHAIHSLEDELGTKLFQKQGRNISLTKYGHLFLEYVQISIGSLDAGIRKIQGMTDEAAGQINLAYVYTLGSILAPKLVRHYIEAHAECSVKFNFSVGNTAEIIKGLREEVYDVAFCSKEHYADDVEFIPFTKEKLVVVLPKGHDLSSKSKIKVTDIINYPFITFNKSSGIRSTIEELFSSNGLEPDIVYEIGEDSSMAGLVAEGFGVAIMPDIPVLKCLNVDVRPLDDASYKRHLHVAYMKDKYISPASRQFIDFIKESYPLN